MNYEEKILDLSVNVKTPEKQQIRKTYTQLSVYWITPCNRDFYLTITDRSF